MHSRRDFLKVSVGAAGASLLAACVAPGTEMAGGVAAVPREQREGVMWGLQYDPHVEAYQRLSDLFASQGGGTFEVQP
ncbi:MAG: twin-arginine translocation signal domain-containing protein [Caldilineaceae bacterium]|nr:twin-arginine translocation signal domain-containing protein [Caldilineaceae bacterium]